MNIRPAAPADAPVIAEFNLRLALETEALRLDADTVRQGVAALLNDASKGLYFLAERDGAAVGQLMITYEWSDWRNGQLWWLQSVYVAPEARGQGVFAALFQHIENMARTQTDVRALRLYMHAQNHRARRTYEKLGMSQTQYQVYELGLD